MRTRFAPVMLLPLLGVAGCTVGPAYVRQPVPAVDGYLPSPPALPNAGPSDVQQKIAGGAAVPDEWWRAFGADSLNTLVDQARSSSPTLATARATLAQAREAVIEAKGAFAPQIDIGGSATRSTRPATQAVLQGQPSSTTTVLSVGPVVSFPLDVFGGLGRQVEQRSALLDVQRAELGAAYLSLTGNVLTQAINVASAAEQLAAAGEIITIDERNLELTRLAAAAGKSAQLDVLSATSQLASDRTLLPPLRQAQDSALSSLSVLVGQSRASWTPPTLTLGSMRLPADLPLSLPSDLIRKRPDIVAAEAQLHAANASIGIASAQLFPTLSISGSWSREAIRGAALFETTANLWDVAASLTAPVFHGGARRAQRRAAIDAYAAQLGTYRETVLEAFGQVADVLGALQHDAEAVEAQRTALEATQASLELTQQAYQLGLASLVQVLDAQRLYQQARLGYARAQAQRYLDTVQFFVALGGGPLPAEDGGT